MLLSEFNFEIVGGDWHIGLVEGYFLEEVEGIKIETRILGILILYKWYHCEDYNAKPMKTIMQNPLVRSNGFSNIFILTCHSSFNICTSIIYFLRNYFRLKKIKKWNNM